MQFERRFLKKEYKDLMDGDSEFVCKMDLYNSGALEYPEKKERYISADNIDCVTKKDTLECDRLLRTLKIKSNYIGYINLCLI